MTRIKAQTEAFARFLNQKVCTPNKYQLINAVVKKRFKSETPQNFKQLKETILNQQN